MSTSQQTSPSHQVESAAAAPEPALLEQEREVLHQLLRVVAERAKSETELASSRTTGAAATDRDYQTTRETLTTRFEARRIAAQQADENRRRTIVETAINGENQAKDEFARASRKIASEFDTVRERAKADHLRERAAATAAYDEAEREALVRFAQDRKPLDDADAIIDAMNERMAAVFADYQKYGLAEPSKTPTRETFKGGDLVGLLFDRLAKLEPDLKLLEGLFIPRAMKGHRYIWLFLVVFLALIVPAVQMQGPAIGAPLAIALALAVGFGLRQWLYQVSKAQVSKLYNPLFQALVDASALSFHCRTQATERLKDHRNKNAIRRDDALLHAKNKNAKAVSAGEAMRDERLRKINEVYASKMVDVQTQREVDLRAAIDAYDKQKVELASQSEAALRELDERYFSKKQKHGASHETAWGQMTRSWHEGIGQVSATIERIGREVNALGPKWDDPAWAERPFPRAIPPVVRFGELAVDMAELPGGISPHAELREGVATQFALPALAPFPDHANMLIEAPREGRAASLDALRAAMLRLLTSLPPGSVRFTIIDPIGIGRNFGAFMHLADFDDALVTQQVWTEPRQIEERLADISAHMERVTQKYLRNEYATIEEYNAVAGEVAEPYRVLVIADFPANFEEKTANRLTGIALGGPPCGVITLLAVDHDRDMPPGFALEDLRPGAICLGWDGQALAWADPDFGRYPLLIDTIPPADAATRLLLRVGAAARDAKRVEVPFEFIAPAPEAIWTKDSRAGLDIPLGKAGATKRQNLALGQGTSQHVLIAGRTGSGKSTLLHALITNVALNYSPDEVELYLIDFKKGVEFKVYATQELPHASVVAIESEREFGISVLQRLDAEMRTRADLFRDAGVQDLNGYRNTPGTPPLPRMMLVVDEFQEFFVEEDKVAQEAALLLDRLVRQGRAFGVHVLLGSQTLGGAYALARSTLGQMAVRIALQCSENDAHLILSESNSAARLLSRPGEAVYNDANGMAEGNHFFQVVWLGDDRREAYLKQIHQRAQEHKPKLARTQIVFEGDAPADLGRNPLLSRLLDEPAWPAAARSAQAWLGDAVAIKDPTAALFRRQGGNHLLIVGQNDESARGIMAAALLSIAAQYPPAESDTVRKGAKLAVLDGTPEDHPQAEILTQVAKALPHQVDCGNWRASARILAAFAAEVERRQQPDAPDGPEMFLFIHDLPRFRDLRRKEDDFGFGRRGEEATPADHLTSILRDGPGLGIHLVTWCDTLNNLNRYFDHQALREFEMRVLFQMSPTDSGHLLDAPHAARLGPHRAYFSSEEQNQLEKFRPYALPPAEWLEKLGEKLRKRASGDHASNT